MLTLFHVKMEKSVSTRIFDALFILSNMKSFFLPAAEAR